MIRATSEEQRDKAQEILRERFKPAKSSVQNTTAALNLGTSSRLLFRGRKYKVGAVGYKPGLELQRHFMRLQALSLPDDATDKQSIDKLNDLEAMLMELVPLIKSLCRPASWVRWAFWRWYNPFEDATQQELGELLGFFCACRMMSSVNFQDSHLELRQLPSTPSMN